MNFADYIKKILDYDETTGVFRWNQSYRKTKKGDIAGYIHHAGYRFISVNGDKYQASHLAWLIKTGNWPKEEIEHINGIRSDDRFCNLKEIKHAESCKNQKLRLDNHMGITGVFVRNKKFTSSIKVDGKLIWLGTFSDFFEVCCARKSAELKYNFHPNHGRKRK